jgi:hypothetical protein
MCAASFLTDPHPIGLHAGDVRLGDYCSCCAFLRNPSPAPPRRREFISARQIKPLMHVMNEIQHRGIGTAKWATVANQSARPDRTRPRTGRHQKPIQ